MIIANIENLKSFLDSTVTHTFLTYNESAYIYNFKERKKQFLIFGFIIGLILSFTTLLSQKKLKE